MSRMPRRRKEFIEHSDVESQDEGFVSSTIAMPHRPPRRSLLNPALKVSGSNAPDLKWFTKNPFLLVLLLGSLACNFFLYEKVDTLEFNSQRVLEKINQLEKVSNEKFSTLFGDTQTYSESITKIKQIEDIVQKSNNKIDDISMSVGFIRHDIRVIEKNITIMNGTIKKEKSTLEVLIKEIRNVKSAQENIKAMQGDIGDDKAYRNSSIKILQKDVEVLYTNISATNDDLITESIKENKLKQVVETVQKKPEKIPDRLQTMNMITEDVSAGIEDKWSWMQRTTVVLVLIAFFLCGVLFYNKIDGMDKRIKYLTEYKDKPSLQFESARIVDQIKRKQQAELQNKFCVISFRPETHKKHRRITRSSVDGRQRIKNMDEADFLVTNCKSVLIIPPCKVLLVFVDHNYQYVILENPIEDEEDIKLLTVQACRKMGADVFVIYVGDEGSESLLPGSLYNPQLTTVAVHFELKQLEQRNRVITCHEKFTITQREKVAQAIA